MSAPTFFLFLILLSAALFLLMHWAAKCSQPTWAKITYSNGREEFRGPFCSLAAYWTWHDQMLRDYSDYVSEIQIIDYPY